MSTPQLLNTPAKHTLSLVALVDRTWQSLREGIIRTAWTPCAKLAEAAVVSVLNHISEGHLRISTPNSTYNFPVTRANSSHLLSAELKVVSDTFWIRLATMGDLGFAEAYMYGEVECEDLISTFQIFLRNRQRLQNLDSKFSFLFSLPQKITSDRFVNSLSNAQANISAHYDISNQMFAGFLSEDMTYSCAIFKDLDSDLKTSSFDLSKIQTCESKVKRALPTPTPTPTNEPFVEHSESPDELYEAQMRKLEHIIRQAQIRPGQRVLEIGSGWGSMAVKIAKEFAGTTVDTLTLSVHQQELARARILQAGPEVASRVKVHLLDYRALPKEWSGSFDRVVSVEMVEAVGREYLEEYFRVIDWALKPDIGVGVVQGITIPEARFERYVREIDFIQKWSKLFPGGFLPTLTLLIQSLESGSQGRLTIDSVSNIGPHYARTLREWRRRFVTKFSEVIEPALREEHPEVMDGERGRREVEIFRRKWLYYYCYCEIGFTTRSLGDHILTFTRDGNQSFGCGTVSQKEE